jgi:hypothetical protein
VGKGGEGIVLRFDEVGAGCTFLSEKMLLLAKEAYRLKSTSAGAAGRSFCSGVPLLAAVACDPPLDAARPRGRRPLLKV